MAAVSIHPSSHRAIFQIESWLCGNAQAVWFMAFGSALVIQKQDPAVKRRRCEDNNLLPRDRRLSISWDESTAYKFWAMPRQRMIEVLKSSPEPVAVTGRAGTCVLFHCNVLHASGHNLSADDRWHIYVSCNTVANKPQLGPNPRPDWVVSRNWNPLKVEDDEGVLKAA